MGKEFVQPQVHEETTDFMNPKAEHFWDGGE